MNALPKSALRGARKALQETYNAEDRDHVEKAITGFDKAYGVKWPKAVKKITGEVDELVAFYDFPAEHWIHLRTANPIESTFSTVKHRTKVTRGAGSPAAASRWSSSSSSPPRPAGTRSPHPTSSPSSAQAPAWRTVTSSNVPRTSQHDPHQPTCKS